MSDGTLIRVVNATRDGGPEIRHIVRCPGCHRNHQLAVEGAYRWEWDGDLEAPTYSPSLLVQGHDRVCHSFIRAGQWQFLDDSTHHLAGQTIPMVPVEA